MIITINLQFLNTVHLFFLQELGASNSSYSLKDQHALNTEFHTPNHQYNFSDVEAIIHKMKDEWKVSVYPESSCLVK